MDSTSRKRHSTDSSVDIPVIKKKKLSKKVVKLTSVEPLPVPVKSPKKKKRSEPKENGGKEKVRNSPEKVPPVLTETTATSSSSGTEEVKATTTDAQPKVRRRKRIVYYKPVNGSWMYHPGSLLVYRCVSQALLLSIDPRDVDEDFDWSTIAGGVISQKDMKLVWAYIKKEFPDRSLEVIKTELRSYSTLTAEDLIRAGVRDQFVSEFPKAPPTTYMLFVQSKSSHVKAKYPNISQTDVAKKLGKKWRSISEEQKEVYKQRYAKLKKDHAEKLEAFYDEHPGAKRPTKPKRGPVDAPSPLDKRIKELKAAMPKSPSIPYMVFCRAKRQKAQNQHPEVSPKDITKRLSKKWKSMTLLQKAKYKNYHEDLKKAYNEKMKLFYELYPDAKELLDKPNKRDSESAAQAARLARETEETDSLDSDSSDLPDVEVPIVRHVKLPPSPMSSPEPPSPDKSHDQARESHDQAQESHDTISDNSSDSDSDSDSDFD